MILQSFRSMICSWHCNWFIK